MGEKRLLPGEHYQCRKEGQRRYQVVAVAIHSETQEELVIYQALYGTFPVYAKPLSLFISEMEPCSLESESEPEKAGDSVFYKNKAAEKKETAVLKEAVSEKQTLQAKEVSPDRTQVLLEFLDCDSYAEKLEYLRDRKKYIDDRMLNDISFALDIVIEEGELEDRIRTLENCLKTFCRYEGTRLR